MEVIKEGLLFTKLDGGTWKKLWFQLRIDRLYYFIDPLHTKNHIGVVDLKGASITPTSEIQTYRKHCFEICVDDERILLSCLTEEDRSEWTVILSETLAQLTEPQPSKASNTEAVKVSIGTTLLQPSSSSTRKDSAIVSKKFLKGFSKKILSLPPPPPLPPWESYESLVLDPSGNPISGTVDRLIERLYNEKKGEYQYHTSFMLTYRSFTTGVHVLKSLLDAHAKYSKMEHDETGQAQAARILNFLRKWSSELPHDFEENQPLLSLYNGFIEANEGMEVPPWKKAGNNPIEKASRASLDDIGFALITALDFDTLETIDLAKQLTLRDTEKFRAIPHWNFLERGWSDYKSPQFRAFLDDGYQTSYWALHDILSSPSDKRQARFRRWIKVADDCYGLCNFHSTFAIMKALQSPEILALKISDTWHNANVFFQAFEELKLLTNARNGYKCYRDNYSKASTQCDGLIEMFYFSSVLFL